MQRLVGLILFVVGTSIWAIAGPVAQGPEISPASGASALALIAGGFLTIRSRKKR